MGFIWESSCNDSRIYVLGFNVLLVRRVRLAHGKDQFIFMVEFNTVG